MWVLRITGVLFALCRSHEVRSTAESNFKTLLNKVTAARRLKKLTATATATGAAPPQAGTVSAAIDNSVLFTPMGAMTSGAGNSTGVTSVPGITQSLGNSGPDVKRQLFPELKIEAPAVLKEQFEASAALPTGSGAPGKFQEAAERFRHALQSAIGNSTVTPLTERSVSPYSFRTGTPVSFVSTGTSAARQNRVRRDSTTTNVPSRRPSKDSTDSFGVTRTRTLSSGSGRNIGSTADTDSPRKRSSRSQIGPGRNVMPALRKPTPQPVSQGAPAVQDAGIASVLASSERDVTESFASQIDKAKAQLQLQQV